jgi:hypothetical protein
MRNSCIGISGLAFLLSLVVFSPDSSLAASCLGNCGTAVAADGVVGVPPTGGNYRWISTYLGVDGAAQMPGVANGPFPDGSLGATNGTLYTTTPFTANAGAALNYNFNYITSDGQTVGGNYVYQDYAWVQVQDLAHSVIATLLTARTEPTGSIIPGTGMPLIDANLTPGSVPIITVDPTLAVGPTWSPLGGSSGVCYGPGCGYTGWVHSTYAIQNAGTYVLVFGVTNWADTAFDSGLAFSGITIGGKNVEGEDDIGQTPLPSTWLMLLSGFVGLDYCAYRGSKKSAVATA